VRAFFIAFFVFGACMCALTIVLLVMPGTSLDVLWLANPEAHAAFGTHRAAATALMLAVSAACASAAFGLAKRARWGRRLAMEIIAVNLAGDLAGAAVRHDARPLIGLPIAGAMLWLLSRLR
jgi:hypothetical protein